MAIGTPNFTRSAIDSPSADFAKTLSAFGTNMMAQAKQEEELKLQRERQAAQDARQVISDQQNKQLFDLKIEDANRAKQDLVDKDAYLKGIVNPSAYGLKAGTEDAVNSLGSYGDDARAQAAVAAGPGSAEYEAHFKTMENLGNYITGKSLDDRTIGFATANPNNRYAAEEAIKASIARQGTLDKEAKDVADNQLKYQLESLKQLGKSSTGISEDGTSSSKVGMTAGGYKVSSPDDVLKDANTIMKDNYGIKSDSPMDARVVKLASRMANAGYSASQVAEVIGTNYTPGKTEKLFGLVDSLWPDKAPVFNDIAPNVGAPKNIAVPTATNTAYTDTLSGLSQSYADRLAKIQEQRDGTYGMDKFRELLNGTTQSSADYTEKGKTASGSSPKYANVKSIDGVPQHLVNSEGVTTESYKDGKGYSIAMGYNLHANKDDIAKDFKDANISADKISTALNSPEKLVLTDEEATRLSQLSTYKYMDSTDRLLKNSGLAGGFDSLSPQMQDMALQMRYRGDLGGETQYGKNLLRLVKGNDLTQLSSYINSNKDNLPKEVVTRFNNALDNPSKTGLRGTMTDADKNTYLAKNSNSDVVNRILGLSKKEEDKKVEEKITTDFSKLNDEDIQTGIEVYTGAEKEAYQKEAIRRRVEKLNYNNTVHAAPTITTEPEVQKDARSGFQMLRDTMVQGAQDTYEQGKKGVKEFVVPLVKPAYDAVFGDKPSPEARTAIALVNNSAGGMLEIAGSPYTAAKRFTDFMVYGESQGDTVFQKQAEVARDTAIKEMNKLGIVDPTKQEIALFVSDAIMPVGALSKTGSIIRNASKNPSANIDNIVARIDDFNKITPSGTAKLDAASAEAAAAVRKSSAAEKLAGVKRIEEYAKDAAEFEARALQKERQAATNIPKDVRDAVEATIKAHADEAPIIQAVSETLQGIGGRGVLSQADEVVILNSLEKLQGLSSKSTIEVLRELKLSPKVERYIMDTFNQQR